MKKIVMKRKSLQTGMSFTLVFAVLFTLVAVPFAFGEGEGEQVYKDTPYFSGMPNYAINDANDKEFDAYRFFNGKSCITVEGQKFFRAYSWNQTGKQGSDLQIGRNYANAIRGMGGTVLFEGECSGFDCAANCGYRMVVGKVVKGKNELWVEVVPFNDGYDFHLTIIAREAMKQGVTYGGMLDTLNSEGHIALYLNFDTGKAVVKPEFQDVIDQIAAMMKDNPALTIAVEGHTDNVGDARKNKALSEDRARAVAAAIVKKGVDTKRLTAAGFGQEKPIADNGTEEGKARNRRVELVRQ
jgi:hypothetical protein